MTNTKKFICILILMQLAISNNVSAQNTNIAFTYDADGNMTSRYIVMIDIPTEIISTELSEHKIVIYPNPTQGEIRVEISPLNLTAKNFMQLFDSSGRLIETKKINSERTYLKISGNPGAYLLNIHLGTNVSKWKIIKQ